MICRNMLNRRKGKIKQLIPLIEDLKLIVVNYYL